MNNTPHASDELLLRFVDDDLPPADAWSVGSHLGSCDTCRNQLDELNDTLQEYLQFHESVLKERLPSPPMPWKPLDFRSAVISRTGGSGPRLLAVTSRRASITPWLLAAAALVLAYLGMNRLQHPPVVKAAELLNRASQAERTSPVHSRTIRIRTRKYKWDRPGRLPARPRASAAVHSPDASGIRRLLETADYSWDDPLSAVSYLKWHDSLADKQDQVAILPAAGSPKSYVIHTTTTASPISDALLTLSASDLHAVACTLRFAAETVEMTEVPDDSLEPLITPEKPAERIIHAEPGAVLTTTAGPGDELNVIAALHRIGADLGEPIEVHREGPNVVVNVNGLDGHRQHEVKNALSAIPAVRMQSGEPEHRDSAEAQRRAPPQLDTANPLVAELQAASPDTVSTGEIGDQIVEYTESVIARVYALRALARRFPPEDAARMSTGETGVLSGLIRDHLAAIAASTGGLERRLGPILPRAGPTPAPSMDTWQNLAQAMLADARSLDQALNSTMAPDDVAGRKRHAAQALADIDQRVARIRSSLRP